MSFTNYLSAAILNHIFNKSTYIAPSLYVGLMSAAPIEDGTGIQEPSGGSYARVLVPETDWTSASASDPSVISNTSLVMFDAATAHWAGANSLTHFGLFDAAEGGNLLASGQLDAPRIVLDGDTAGFPVGTLIFSLS